MKSKTWLVKPKNVICEECKFLFVRPEAATKHICPQCGHSQEEKEAPG